MHNCTIICTHVCLCLNLKLMIYDAILPNSWQKEASEKSPKSEKMMFLNWTSSMFYIQSEFWTETLIGFLLKDIYLNISFVRVGQYYALPLCLDINHGFLQSVTLWLTYNFAVIACVFSLFILTHSQARRSLPL